MNHIDFDSSLVRHQIKKWMIWILYKSELNKKYRFLLMIIEFIVIVCFCMVLFVPSTDNRRFYKSFKISIIFWPLTISQNPSRYLLFWLCVWCVYCFVGLPLVVNNTALILSHHFNILRLFLSREYKCHRGHNHNDQGEVEHCNRMSMMTLLAWVLIILMIEI